MGHFLLTSAHYPRSWSRNTPFRTLKLACHNGKFLTSGDRYTSMTFDQKILRGVRRQVLYSRHVNCTAVPWGSLSLLVVPLASVNSFHYWLVIGRCSCMFNFNSCIRMLELVLLFRSRWSARPWILFVGIQAAILLHDSFTGWLHQCLSLFIDPHRMVAPIPWI